MTTPFTPVPSCWVCGGGDLHRIHDAIFELAEYRRQDPPLAEYTGRSVDIVRCGACGFAQPAALPSLDRYFDRMYDQRWTEDWIRQEHEADYKDLIFSDVLGALAARLPAGRRRLLDVGAHAGRFIKLARAVGWEAEGIELNPQTAAYAERASGAAVHQVNVHDFDPGDRLYDAITITDVLEHVPEPRTVLERIHQLLQPGGWIAVKVPNAPAQRIKERTRGLVQRGYRPTLADNLVHVNHFSPSSLRLALTRAGFRDVWVGSGAPELPAPSGPGRVGRLAAWHLTRTLPGGVHSPLAFNLQAYGCRG